MKKIPWASAAAMAAIACQAGVKYWDNPEFKSFDVGDYVQDGLVVNYDGIRNAGPNAPHNPNATTWVNCANPGTYDATRYSLVANGNSASWVAGAGKGIWADYGFTFNTNAVFHQGASFTIPTRYSIQVLVDAKGTWQTSSGGKIGYVMCPYNASGWDTCSMGIRRGGFTYDGTNLDKSFYLVAQNAVGGRPAFGAPHNFPFTYGTAIVNVNDGVMFSGTVAPWSATTTTDGHRSSQTATPANFVFANGFSIGGHYPRTDELFFGTIKSYRFYNRCLTDAEVLWNRVVDEARYFGRSRVITAIPVTNVVEATTIPGVKDRHYAIDAGGFSFTAPESRTEGGRRYTLGGYTLETWNGSAWSSGVQHAGEASCTVSDVNALVRITWLYTVVPGEGLVTYDVGDYVQDGLVWNYDGIRNVGANADHDPSATTWANLGSAGSAYDLSLQRLDYQGSDLVNVGADGMSGGWNPGAWTENGYLFCGESRFRNGGAVNAGTDYTLQTLVDAKSEEQKGKDGTEGYILSASWHSFAILIRGAGATNPRECSFGWNLQAATNRPYFYHESHEYRYATAILNGSTQEAAFFEGTEIPASGKGYFKYGTLEPFSGNGYSVGGYGSGDHLFTGEMKFLRYYNRSLTAAEVALNRRVDNYRYFGIPPVTNVVVCSTLSYLEGNEKCGMYQVDNAYTFTAPERRTAANGVTYSCTGYTIETANSAGNWGAPVFHDSRSYAATGSGKVRLTWIWKGAHGVRSASDYGIDDYVSAGLKLHFDGICNVGAGKPHANGVKWWRNLGSNGMDSDATLQGGNKSDASAWADDGYNFCGRKRFVIANAGIKAGSSYSMQFHTDIDRSLLVDADQHNYIYSGSWNNMAVTIWRRSSPYLRAGSDVSFKLGEGEHLTYFNGIMDQTGSSPTAYVFPGTTFNTGTVSISSKLNTPTSNNPNLGGWGGDIDAQTSQMLVGKIKNFRYYDRVLTEEERVRNRQVDSARFFGKLATTNVIVAVEDGSNITAAETVGEAYFVEGEYTFRAVGDSGLGYRLSIPDGNGGWRTLRGFAGGDSYTYTSGISPALVKVEWCIMKPFVLIVR